MGKANKKSRAKKPTPEVKTPPPTCEIFGCDCTRVYACERCEKRVCAAHFLGTDGVVTYFECLPMEVCARCPFCKEINSLSNLNNKAESDKLKNQLSEFTKSNGDIEFDLGVASKVSGMHQVIGSVALQWRPCSGGCCAGKLHFYLESKCSF